MTKKTLILGVILANLSQICTPKILFEAFSSTSG